MMHYIKVFFRGIMDRIFGKKIFEKKSMKSIDFSDVLSGYSDLRVLPDDLSDDFKCFSSMDDYNKDLLSVFQAYKKDIVLDYSQKDGHFKV